ncbi:hypothetical protein CLV95_10226 [Leptospira borgpetersenii serovar Javanica]|nr:hypothetical protein CLV95_10226 [Leptospira borgpetersenii serovar Javanica]
MSLDVVILDIYFNIANRFKKKILSLELFLYKAWILEPQDSLMNLEEHTKEFPEKERQVKILKLFLVSGWLNCKVPNSYPPIPYEDFKFPAKLCSEERIPQSVRIQSQVHERQHKL